MSPRSSSDESETVIVASDPPRLCRIVGLITHGSFIPDVSSSSESDESPKSSSLNAERGGSMVSKGEEDVTTQRFFAGKIPSRK